MKLLEHQIISNPMEFNYIFRAMLEQDGELRYVVSRLNSYKEMTWDQAEAHAKTLTLHETMPSLIELTK